MAKTKFPELIAPEGSGTAPLAAGIGSLADIAGVVLLFENWKGALLAGAISVVLATGNLWRQRGRVIGRAVFSVFLVGLLGAGLVGASVHHYLSRRDRLPIATLGRGTPHHEPAPESSESTQVTRPGHDPKGVRLGQLQPVDGGDAFVSGAESVNATHYEQTLHADDFGCDTTQTYQLDHKYATFQSDIGIGDTTQANNSLVKFTVVVDGHERDARTLGLGKIGHVKVPVGGAFRLEIGVAEDGFCSDDAVAVWINPTLIP